MNESFINFQLIILLLLFIGFVLRRNTKQDEQVGILNITAKDARRMANKNGITHHVLLAIKKKSEAGQTKLSIGQHTNPDIVWVVEDEEMEKLMDILRKKGFMVETCRNGHGLFLRNIITW